MTKYALVFITALSFGCSGTKPVDILGVDYSGYIVVSTVATDPATGPGVVSIFTPEGHLHQIVHDYYNNGSDFVNGTAFVPPNKLVFAINGSNRLESYNITTDASTVLNTSGLTGFTLKSVVRSTRDGSIYVVKTAASPAVDRFDPVTGVRSAFVPATVGSCALVTPYGIAYDPVNDRIAVISSAASGRLSIYDQNGACISHLTGASYPAINAGTPVGITYHALSGKFLVTQATSHAIYAMNTDGTANTLIYQNSAIINTPRAITTDSQGYIYVSSIGTDSIEKLYWNGTGSATRVTSTPLIGTQVLSQNVTSIVVIE